MYRNEHSRDISHEADDFKYRLQSGLVTIITAVTVFAALPVFIESDIYKILLLFIWVLNLVFNITLFKAAFSGTTVMILISWAVYGVYCVVMYIIRGGGYINGTYFYSVSLCIFIYLNGCFLAHNRTRKTFETVAKVYNACSLIVLLNIYMTSFWGVQYLEIETYIYEAKNSIGPIIVTNLIILAMREKSSKALFKIFYLLYQIFFVYLLLLVNNRAGVAELVVVLACYILFAEKSPKPVHTSKQKSLSPLYAFIPGCIALIAMILYGDFLINKVTSFLNWSLRLGDLRDLNSFSSGRLELYDLAVNYAIKANPLFGIGMWYTDLFYLSILAEVGIIGAIPIFIIVINILLIPIKNFKSKNPELTLLCLLAVQTLTSTLFEGLPPFGPGTVVFLFWLLFGAYMGSKYQ